MIAMSSRPSLVDACLQRARAKKAPYRSASGASHRISPPVKASTASATASSPSETKLTLSTFNRRRRDSMEAVRLHFSKSSAEMMTKVASRQDAVAVDWRQVAARHCHTKTCRYRQAHRLMKMHDEERKTQMDPLARYGGGPRHLRHETDPNMSLNHPDRHRLQGTHDGACRFNPDVRHMTEEHHEAENRYFRSMSTRPPKRFPSHAGLSH